MSKISFKIKKIIYLKLYVKLRFHNKNRFCVQHNGATIGPLFQTGTGNHICGYVPVTGAM